MKIETPISILVKRRAALGDVVMSTAVVRELHKQYNGNCAITVETEFPLVYKNNPYIVDLRNWGEVNNTDFDVVINLDDAYELNPDNHFIDSMLFRAFGNNVSKLNRAPDLHADENDRATVDADIKDIGPFFAVHMRNWHWALKNIDIEIWCDIFAKVFEQNSDTKVVVVGGPTDYMLEHPLFIDARAKYTPQQLAYLLDSAECFVGIDSGPFNIAGASSTHIIGLLTHNPPENIMPIRKFDAGWHTTSIQASIDCVGCNVKQARPVRGINCIHGDFRCNKLWDTQKIADAILTQIGK
jgi:ADP-heptose:LPS heptosyltransferase